MGGLLATLTSMIAGSPAAQAMIQSAENFAVQEFLKLIDTEFHVSPPTAGAAVVVEPKVGRG